MRSRDDARRQPVAIARAIPLDEIRRQELRLHLLGAAGALLSGLTAALALLG